MTSNGYGNALDKEGVVALTLQADALLHQILPLDVLQLLDQLLLLRTELLLLLVLLLQFLLAMESGAAAAARCGCRRRIAVFGALVGDRRQRRRSER